jgi:hypothetical protein
MGGGGRDAGGRSAPAVGRPPAPPTRPSPSLLTSSSLSDEKSQPPSASTRANPVAAAMGGVGRQRAAAGTLRRPFQGGPTAAGARSTRQRPRPRRGPHRVWRPPRPGRGGCAGRAHSRADPAGDRPASVPDAASPPARLPTLPPRRGDGRRPVDGAGRRPSASGAARDDATPLPPHTPRRPPTRARPGGATPAPRATPPPRGRPPARPIEAWPPAAPPPRPRRPPPRRRAGARRQRPGARARPPRRRPTADSALPFPSGRRHVLARHLARHLPPGHPAGAWGCHPGSRAG